MRCLIVDDEVPAREELRYLLDNIENVEVVGDAEDGRTALEKIKMLKPDVIFLDIQMRGMSGFDLANELIKLKNYPLVVFITAYDQYAIKAFEINAVDYVLKPISEVRLRKTITRVESLVNQQNDRVETNIAQLLEYISKAKAMQKICVYSNGKHIPLDPEDIVYINVIGRNTVIKSKKGEFVSNLNLGELEEKLKNYHFFRCHRSYLININEILEINHGFHGTYEVILRGFTEEKIPVSRSNVNLFKSIMNL